MLYSPHIAARINRTHTESLRCQTALAIHSGRGENGVKEKKCESLEDDEGEGDGWVKGKK